MKFCINYQTFESQQQVAEWIWDDVSISEQEFDEMLDEIYGYVRVMGIAYATSDVLKSVDPIHYRCSYNDWIDEQLENRRSDAEYVLGKMKKYDQVVIGQWRVECISDGTEDQEDD